MQSGVRTSKGFTLLEIMVVMAIVAILVSAVTLSIQRAASRDIEAQLNRLLDWATSLSERAQLEGGMYGLSMVDSELVAVGWFDSTWWQIAHGRPPQLAEQLDLVVDDWEQPERVEDQPMQYDPFLVFTPSGSIVEETSMRFRFEDYEWVLQWQQDQPTDLQRRDLP